LLVSRALFKRNGKLEKFGGFKREIQASFKNKWWIQEGNPKPSFKKESRQSSSRGTSGPCAIGGPSINNNYL
jgi:hypothetical protein